MGLFPATNGYSTKSYSASEVCSNGTVTNLTAKKWGNVVTLEFNNCETNANGRLKTSDGNEATLISELSPSASVPFAGRVKQSSSSPVINPSLGFVNPNNDKKVSVSEYDPTNTKYVGCSNGELLYGSVTYIVSQFVL